MSVLKLAPHLQFFFFFLSIIGLQLNGSRYIKCWMPEGIQIRTTSLMIAQYQRSFVAERIVFGKKKQSFCINGKMTAHSWLFSQTFALFNYTCTIHMLKKRVTFSTQSNAYVVKKIIEICKLSHLLLVNVMINRHFDTIVTFLIDCLGIQSYRSN